MLILHRIDEMANKGTFYYNRFDPTKYSRHSKLEPLKYDTYSTFDRYMGHMGHLKYNMANVGLLTVPYWEFFCKQNSDHCGENLQTRTFRHFEIKVSLEFQVLAFRFT